MRAYLRNKGTSFTRFLCILSAVARSSCDDNNVHYLLPVLWITSCLFITDLEKAMQTHQGLSGAKSVVYDCFVIASVHM